MQSISCIKSKKQQLYQISKRYIIKLIKSGYEKSWSIQSQVHRFSRKEFRAIKAKNKEVYLGILMDRGKKERQIICQKFTNKYYKQKVKKKQNMKLKASDEDILCKQVDLCSTIYENPFFIIIIII